MANYARCKAVKKNNNKKYKEHNNNKIEKIYKQSAKTKKKTQKKEPHDRQLASKLRQLTTTHKVLALATNLAIREGSRKLKLPTAQNDINKCKCARASGFESVISQQWRCCTLISYLQQAAKSTEVLFFFLYCLLR